MSPTDERIERLERQVEMLLATVEAQAATINAQAAEIVELKRRLVRSGGVADEFSTTDAAETWQPFRFAVLRAA